MCAPAVLLGVAAGAVAIGGGTSAYNQYQSGIAQNKYYQSQADQSVLEGKNALKQGELQSTLVQDQASHQGKQLVQNQAEFNASQRAVMAANGIYGGGTAEDVTSSTFTKEELDQRLLRYNADIKSWEGNTQAQYKNWALNTQAEDLRYQGKLAKDTGRKNAFSTLLSTATQVASIYK